MKKDKANTTCFPMVMAKVYSFISSKSWFEVRIKIGRHQDNPLVSIDFAIC